MFLRIINKPSVIQFFNYTLVSSLAFITDYLILFILTFSSLHYLFASSLAFLFGIATNYSLSKRFIFAGCFTKFNIYSEISMYILIGIIGLIMTIIIIYFLVELSNLNIMIAKLISSTITLIWNFLSRKYFIYKNYNNAKMEII